ncbi:uncharacterized protein LOC134558763 isoform X3 [Prinia subflava]|uniref:uncharacterized protein LOC134558763 isoform X3 n=1 Tax=Prinia subflava TaxID=208062 RepID=UPI002FE28CF9
MRPAHAGRHGPARAQARSRAAPRERRGLDGAGPGSGPAPGPGPGPSAAMEVPKARTCSFPVGAVGRVTAQRSPGPRHSVTHKGSAYGDTAASPGMSWARAPSALLLTHSRWNPSSRVPYVLVYNVTRRSGQQWKFHWC